MSLFYSFTLISVFIWAMLGLTARARWSRLSKGYSLAVVHGLLTAAASLAVECGLQGARASGAAAVGSAVVALGLQSTGLGVMAHGLSCSAACGIFPNQGSNLLLLHWQADSLSLSHQGIWSLITVDSSCKCHYVEFVCLTFHCASHPPGLLMLRHDTVSFFEG